MIALEYKMTLEDLAKATHLFLENRPVLRILFAIVTVCSLLILIAFALQWASGSSNFNSIMSGMISFFWLFYRKKITLWFVRKNLQLRKVHGHPMSIQILKHKITWKTKQTTEEQPWRQLKKIYKLSEGYIIPLVGFKFSGQFIWLPNNAFIESHQLFDFKKIMSDKNIKVCALS